MKRRLWWLMAFLQQCDRNKNGCAAVLALKRRAEGISSRITRKAAHLFRMLCTVARAWMRQWAAESKKATGFLILQHSHPADAQFHSLMKEEKDRVRKYRGGLKKRGKKNQGANKRRLAKAAKSGGGR
jgi:hypothetical protein